MFYLPSVFENILCWGFYIKKYYLVFLDNKKYKKH